MWWMDSLGRVLRGASTLGRCALAAALDVAFGPPGLTPPLPPGARAQAQVAAREAVARLDEEEAARRGDPVTPLPVRMGGYTPCVAAPDLAVHVWCDGEAGHTGDLWRSPLTAADISCPVVFELTGVGEPVDVYCHKPPRHEVRELTDDPDGEPVHEGLDSTGRLRRWVMRTRSSATDDEQGDEGVS